MKQMENEDLEYNKAFFGEEEAPIIEEAEEIAPIEEEAKEEAQEEVTEEVKEEEPAEEEPIEEEAKEEAPAEMVKLIWNGKEIEVTKEEAIKLAQQGFDYTFKAQSISKYKKQIESMMEAGIQDEDLQLLAKVKQGDREALAFLAKQQNIDPFELVSIENPNPTLQKSTSEIVVSDEVKPLMEQISHNTELLGKLQQAESVLPSAVIKAMAQNPELFYGVVSEVANGTFDEVMPQLQRQLSTMSDLDRAYVMQNPNQFATLYMQVKNTAKKEAPQPIVEVKKEKPNMAEVGIKKSQTVTRQEEVIKDAFNSDAEYQKILARVRNQ